MEQQIERLAEHIQNVLEEKGPLSSDSLHSTYIKTIFYEVNNRLYLFRISGNATIQIIAKEPIYKLDFAGSYPISDESKITLVASLQKGICPKPENQVMYDQLEKVITDIQSYLDNMKAENEQ